MSVIYWYDLVTLKGKGGGHEHGQCGVVVKGMPDNRLGVRRANGTVVAAAAAGLRIVDRSNFRAGDIVASASDPAGQIGVVTGVSRALHLVRFDADDDGPAAEAQVVSSTPEELRRVTELVLGDYVVSGPWLGSVAEVSLDVDVTFHDGAVCRLTAAERKLVPAQAEDSFKYDLQKMDRQTNSVLYPGQRVAGDSPSVFQASRWIKGYWKPSRVRGTVGRVDVAGVLVHWVASAVRTTADMEPPAAWQPDLQKLSLFRHPAAEASVWYVGDRCFFRNPPPCHDHPGGVDDAPPPSAGVVHGRPTTWRRPRKTGALLRPDRQRTQAELEQRPMSVAGTRTTVDVLWQDGTRQCGVPSPSLCRFNKAGNDYDFFPGQHVVCRAAAAGEAVAAARSGVVQSFNCKDKTVCVSWFKPATTTMEDGCSETVSTYDLARDLDANFFYGDVVRLRRPLQVIAKDGNDASSWVGHIVHLCDDGHIQVSWGDGNTSKVSPREIAVVKRQKIREMLRELGDWLYDNGDMDGELEQEGTSSAAQGPVVAIAGADSSSVDNGESDDDTEDNGPLATTTAMDRVRSVIRALLQLAGGVFAPRRSSEPGSEQPAAMEDVEAATLMSRGDGSSSSSSSEVKAGDGKPSPFPRFDVVHSPPDHHFLDNMGQGTAVGKKWTKRVQKEWRTLENDLPDTIYVRAFEDRMDLVRVVMVGASGTPYHDGLFFFDLHLPPQYPAEPPLVSYRSFGLRVNPNLYPSGTVCLSLLNTFGGEGAELWSPEASNLLQVVVSIQGLVLTAQPYYNEPAHGAKPGTAMGLRNELPYNENTYLLSLQTMLHLLRRPPAGFEAFVRDHFCRRGQHVIRACEAYRDGCLVGTLDQEGRPTEGSRERPCSAGFRIALLNIVPRLVEAFACIGAQGC